MTTPLPTAPPPHTPLCVPDAFLTEERLQVLFNEFNACLSQAVPRGAIFRNLVNSVRQLYVSQILILQQDQVSRDTPDEQGFVDLIITRHDRQMATQHAQLTAQREKEVAELTERHKQQMQDMIRRHDLESAKWATYIPSRWIVGLDVVYGEQEAQKPPNCIMELTGCGHSIGYRLDGPYVWLVPRYDIDPTNALTSVDISIQEYPDNSKVSVARGAAGKYRYLIPQFVQNANKIYAMDMIRVDRAIAGPPVGYDGCTKDINTGRKGGWLYLIWKSQSV